MKANYIMIGMRIPIEIHNKLKKIAKRKYCSMTYAVIDMICKEENKYYSNIKEIIK